MKSDLPAGKIDAKQTPSENERTRICDFQSRRVEYSLYSLVSNTCSEATNKDSFILRGLWLATRNEKNGIYY